MKLLFFLLLIPTMAFSQNEPGPEPFSWDDFRPHVGLISGGKKMNGAYAGLTYTKLMVWQPSLSAEVVHIPAVNRTPLCFVFSNHLFFKREDPSPFFALNLGTVASPYFHFVEIGGGIKGRKYNMLGQSVKTVIAVHYRLTMPTLVNHTWESQGDPFMTSGLTVRVGLEF